MNGAVFTLSGEEGLVCRMEMDKRKEMFIGEFEETMKNFCSLSSKRKLGEESKKYMQFFGAGR